MRKTFALSVICKNISVIHLPTVNACVHACVRKAPRSPVYYTERKGLRFGVKLSDLAVLKMCEIHTKGCLQRMKEQIASSRERKRTPLPRKSILAAAQVEFGKLSPFSRCMQYVPIPPTGCSRGARHIRGGFGRREGWAGRNRQNQIEQPCKQAEYV